MLLSIGQPRLCTSRSGPSMKESLAVWAHQKSGHLGVDGARKWAEAREVALTHDGANTVVTNCKVCQHIKPRGCPIGPWGQIRRGTGPAKMWYMIISGHPQQNKNKYVLTMVDPIEEY